MKFYRIAVEYQCIHHDVILEIILGGEAEKIFKSVHVCAWAERFRCHRNMGSTSRLFPGSDTQVIEFPVIE